MQPSPRHRAVESRFRQLITDAELPQPDEVEYFDESVMFRWPGPKVAVVVDFDDFPRTRRPADGARSPAA